MKNYVLDASAAVRYLTNGVGGEKVDALIRRAHKDEVNLLITAVNWGEALYVLAPTIGLNKATSDLKTLSAVVELVIVDEALAEAAASVKFHYKLGYADCFAAALAMGMDAALVTTDPDFSKLGKRLKVLSLRRDSA
ncbi:MAG: type II toxin-antitoxin system VapC family toxin [Terracidiphilus sp.]|jgi:predicted nucleic acid-binding protein